MEALLQPWRLTRLGLLVVEQVENTSLDKLPLLLRHSPYTELDDNTTSTDHLSDVTLAELRILNMPTVRLEQIHRASCSHSPYLMSSEDSPA